MYTVLYDYLDENGEREQKSAGSFDNKTAAKDAADEIEGKKKHNLFVVPQTETVREFVDRWVPIRANLRKWSHSYLDTARLLLEKHVLSEIGHVSMQAVTPLRIDSLFAKLQAKKCDGHMYLNKPKGEIPTLSGSTLASIYTITKCFFDAAVKWKVIEENPVTLEKPSKDKDLDIFANWDDIETSGIWDLQMMLSALHNISDEMLHLMVHIASAHTCRNGELCGLAWDCVHLDKGGIMIKRTLQRISKKSFDELPAGDVFKIFPNKNEGSGSILVLKRPKTKGSVRWLLLTNPIIEELRRRKEQVEKDKQYYGEDYQDHGLVFCQSDGSPIEPHLVEKMWAALPQRC
jgi:integrase